MSEDTGTWRDYCVLLVDIMVFSESVKNASQRTQLAQTYQKVVDQIFATGINLDLPKYVLRRVLKQRLEFGQDYQAAVDQYEAERQKHAAIWRSRVRVFSDSLFFFFDADNPPMRGSPASSYYLGLRAAQISQGLWIYGLPHRGAISHGECFIDAERSIFLGEAIVKAARWEKEQEWLGISVDPSSEERVSELLKTANSALTRRDIVTKSGRILGLCSDFTNPIVRGVEEPGRPTLTEIVLDGFAKCFDAARARGDLRALAKYSETARMFLRQGLKHPRLDEMVPGGAA